MNEIAKYVLGAVSGALATLIGAGVLFPPSDWSPTLEKSGTAVANATISAVPYRREVLVQGGFEGVSAKDGFLVLSIKTDLAGEAVKLACNIPERTYKNPKTSEALVARDFCLLELPANQKLAIEVSANEQAGVDSVRASLVLRTRRVGRAII
jgi:hypothetical protein